MKDWIESAVQENVGMVEVGCESELKCLDHQPAALVNHLNRIQKSAH